MHGYFGNSELSTGYSCLMEKLVASWRKLWSATPSTTDPNAPFGLVTLAPSGSEGGKSIGTMRWAQTAGYGVTPNPALPNVFTAQAFDLDDPFANITCYHAVGCHDNSPVPPGGWPGGCDQYCASVKTTNFYMGPIHPRDKRPVGSRLAQVAMSVAYGTDGVTTGPTVSGCKYDESAQTVTVFFNDTLLKRGDDSVVVQSHYKGTDPKFPFPASKMEVLTNASLFCMQLGGGGCLDDGTGKPFNASWSDTVVWKIANISLGSSANQVVIDLRVTNGTAFAIRYAQNGDCCSENPATSGPCIPGSCPIVGSNSKLPANPFTAKIVNGKCECIAPQVCDQ